MLLGRRGARADAAINGEIFCSEWKSSSGPTHSPDWQVTKTAIPVAGTHLPICTVTFPDDNAVTIRHNPRHGGWMRRRSPAESGDHKPPIGPLLKWPGGK